MRRWKGSVGKRLTASLWEGRDVRAVLLPGAFGPVLCCAVLCCEHRDSVPSVFPINCVRKDGAGLLRDGPQVAVRL